MSHGTKQPEPDKAREVGVEMLISDYVQAVKDTDALLENDRSLAVRRYGLFGQVGGLLELVKKQQREAQLGRMQSSVLEEVGDITWYVVALARQLGVDVATVFIEAAKVLGANRSVEIKSFEDLDRVCLPIELETNSDVLLHELAACAGSILSISPTDKDQFKELVGLVAALLRVVANERISTAEAVQENVKKTRNRWRQDNDPFMPPLDSSAKHYEQFPSELRFDFIGRDRFVYLQINGVNIGDRLTDNSTKPDGYRFHDIFHIAYAVYLGWSPVLRALLKLKRKSQAEVDENQDGARAIIIEEGVATWIFNHATSGDNDCYRNVKSGQLPYRLLKQVSQMTRGFEVETRPLWQWEEAILNGFRAFRELRSAGSGSVVARFHSHELLVERMSGGQQ